MPPKIKIIDLPKGQQVSDEELDSISGGLSISGGPLWGSIATSVVPDRSPLTSIRSQLRSLPISPQIDCW
jgi:hypothetical protein